VPRTRPAPLVPGALLTGCPGAGKTTISSLCVDGLVAQGIAGDMLDGDELRDRIEPRLGFSKTDRGIQFARALFLAELLAAHRVVPILALVAPYREHRRMAEQAFAQAGWVEVFLDPPADTCIERDPHGVYTRLAAKGGRASIDAGVFDIYEPPGDPALRIDTSQTSAKDAADAIVGRLGTLVRSATR